MKKTIIMALMVLITVLNVHAFEAKVVGIKDGDTIKVLDKDNKQIDIRLYGVDAPEKAQDFGNKAKEFTSDLVFSKVVQVDVITDKDRYGRSVAIISTDKYVLNEQLVLNGFAWYYAEYCKNDVCSKYAALEKEAKAKKINLWSMPNALEPWKFRKGELPSGTDMAYSVNIKTNTVHRIGCKYYECKDCNLRSKYVDDYKKDPKYKPCGVCKPY